MATSRSRNATCLARQSGVKQVQSSRNITNTEIPINDWKQIEISRLPLRMVLTPGECKGLMQPLSANDRESCIMNNNLQNRQHNLLTSFSGHDQHLHKFSSESVHQLSSNQTDKHRPTHKHNLLCHFASAEVIITRAPRLT